ncbi:recombinase RecA [Aggregicoccus sp. 17bor-14]|uniref:ImuA family protein n=1 Tax=Myxococcaceae TaxID=31 RepID=UPI00129CEF80|nr:MULTISPECIES: recombinase RecA [Myxococcaceae]MBF5040984.1 recombinase RecA [Simulacricoccus sp. 17bor-14]MRI86771.1 recombinase RecA [Aggregicoccus sp. 17bor-14]
MSGVAERSLGAQAAGAVGAGTVEQLRERIRQLQAAPRSYLATLRTGVAAFDALLPAGGLPLGQAVELCGEAASGRTGLALRAVGAAHRERRLCAYVDGPGELYPPAAASMGVDLSRLLIARPRERAQLGWTALQLARSGAFACVVLDLTHTGVRLSLAEGKKLADAAFRGGGLLLLLTSPEAPGEGMLRVRTRARGAEGFAVELLRSRQGGMGVQRSVPWAALYPALVQDPLPGARARALPPQAQSVPSLRRERASARRNGHDGILGQRPGRDAHMPRLHAGLGVSSRH